MRIEKGAQALGDHQRWRLPDGVTLPSIDPETERKLHSDRLEHGIAYMRVLQDGRIEHVPFDLVLAPTSDTALPWLRKVG